MVRPTVTALLCLCATLSILQTHGLKASEWVTQARATANSFDEAKRIVITVTGGCVVTTTIAGGAPVTGNIAIGSGESAILEICGAADNEDGAYMRGTELFAASAVRKVQATEGYVKGDILAACKGQANGCCQVYFVPVTPGLYPLTNDNCNDDVLATVEVTGVASDTLEQETLPQWVAPADRNAEVANATEGSWPGWETALEIELTLVSHPECNLPEGKRRLQQLTDASFTEGDAGEDPLAAKLTWVYSGGHSGTTSTLATADALPVAEGEGQALGRRLVQASVVAGEFVNAHDHPIEMIVNKPYLLTYNLLRSGGVNYYFTAPEFFADAVTRRISSPNTYSKWQTYPTEIELFGDEGSYVMYVVPTVVGEYDIRSSDLPESDLPYGKIRVIDGTPTDGAQLMKVPIATGECAVEAGSPAPTATPSVGAALASVASVGTAVFITLATIFLSTL